MQQHCSQHPDCEAVWTCRFCRVPVCDACVETKRVGEEEVRVCRNCGGRCEELSPPAPAISDKPTARPRSLPLASMWEALVDAVGFPFRREGIIDLIVTIAFLVAAEMGLGYFGTSFMLIGSASGTVVGLMAWIFFVLPILVLLAIYFLRIIESTAGGSNEPPGWPDLQRSEFWRTIAALLVSYLVSHGPYLAYQGFVLGFAEGLDGIAWALLALGAVYYPMALLAIVILDNPNAALPDTILPAILRTAGEYLPCVVLWFVLAVIRELTQLVVGAGSVVGAIFAIAVWVYVLTVEMRLLGLFYRRNEARLGWF